MKINKKDIFKKYVLPILIFGGIIFLATMKGSTVEVFDIKKCQKKIKASAKKVLKGCKSWNEDDEEWTKCEDDEIDKRKKIVKKWSAALCNSEKTSDDFEKKYDKKFTSWSGKQLKNYLKLSEKQMKKSGGMQFVESGGAPVGYSQVGNLPLRAVLSVKF